MKKSVSFFLMMIPVLLAGQEIRRGTEDGPRRLGLVLSGGGAKGLAHIGALKVFEEEKLDVKVITGTSMGSIVGGLYAIGYSAADLERIALSTDWQKVLTDRISRKRDALEKKTQEGRYLVTLPIDSGKIRLPESLVAGQLVSEMLSQLTLGYHQEMDFADLPIPFGAVAADIETGEPVLFRKGILPEAIRASMSIPTMFKPIKLNGRTWVDGGITRNLPAVEALEMGADVLIAVDVSLTLKEAEKLRNVLEILEQTVAYSMSMSSNIQKEYCDLVIEPQVDAWGLNDYENAAAIIKAGEQAARAALPQIRALADSLGLRRDNKPAQQLENKSNGHFKVTGLYVKNLQDVSLGAVRSDLNLSFPRVLSAKDIEEAVARVFGSGYFSSVRWRLVPESSTTWQLVLDVEEARTNSVRLGFRFDSYNRASLLFNLIQQNWLRRGSLFSVDLRVGDDVMFDSQLFYHTSYRPRLGVRLNVNAFTSALDVYDNERRRVDRVRTNAVFADMLTGVMYKNWLVAGGGGRLEYFQYTSNRLPDGTHTLSQSPQWYLSWYGLLWLDRLDRSAFPESGHSLQVRISAARKELQSPENFAFSYADFKGLLPVTDELSLLGRSYAGFGTRGTLPFHYQFFMGGMNTPAVYGSRHVPFLGLPPVQYSSNNVRMLQAGLQYEVVRNRYVQLIYNAGSVFDEWSDVGRKTLIQGGGIVVGGLTPFGPIDISLGASSANTLRIEINAGFRF
jgi:NTE family protein